MSRPRTGLVERLAVRLFAHARNIPFASRRDGVEWSLASDTIRETFRGMARAAVHFLADSRATATGPVTVPACERAVQAERWDAYLETLDPDAREWAESMAEVGERSRLYLERTVFDLVREKLDPELEPDPAAPREATGPR